MSTNTSVLFALLIAITVFAAADMFACSHTHSFPFMRISTLLCPINSDKRCITANMDFLRLRVLNMQGHTHPSRNSSR